MMKIELDTTRREALVGEVQTFFQDMFDMPLSDFRAEALIDHFLTNLGPTVYNQAIQDVRAHLQRKLDDLDGEVYADEA